MPLTVIFVTRNNAIGVADARGPIVALQALPGEALVIDGADNRRLMGEAAIRRAVHSWASAVVSNRYSQVFDAAMGGGHVETAATRRHGADSSAANEPG